MDDEKQQLDHTIESARDRVGDRIDELDRRMVQVLVSGPKAWTEKEEATTGA